MRRLLFAEPSSLFLLIYNPYAEIVSTQIADKLTLEMISRRTTSRWHRLQYFSLSQKSIRLNCSPMKSFRLRPYY